MSIEALDTETEESLWNLDTGQPSIALFANAVQVWAVAQDRTGVAVDEAAFAFNVKPELIRQAVNWHPWMLLEDDDTIGHEGE